MRRVQTFAPTSFVVTVLLLAVAPASAQSRGLRPTDFYDEVGVGNVAISPAGDLVAFTVTTIDEDKNRRHREVWLQRLRGGRGSLGIQKTTCT